MPRAANYQPPPHGTYAAYQRHWVNGEEACAPCKAANAAKSRQYRLDNPEKVREHDKKSKAQQPSRYSRANVTLRKYGLTEDSYDALLNRQDRKCAICTDDFTPKRGPQIDHDHAHGHTRGILCFQCNIGLGNFYDSPSLLRAAAKYLEDHSVDRPRTIESPGRGSERDVAKAS